MTTIQDRIKKDYKKNFKSYIKNISVGQYNDKGVNIGFKKADILLEQFLIQSIKEVEEETRKEVEEKYKDFKDLVNISHLK